MSANSGQIPWERARERCLREALRMGFSEADAQDIVQEALLRGWRWRDRSREATWLPWLLTITRNEARRLHKRNRRHEAADLETCPAQVGSGAAQAAARIDIARAAQQLTEAERVAVGLHYTMGYSHSAAAHQLDVSEVTVRVRLHRARKKLRRTLADEVSNA